MNLKMPRVKKGPTVNGADPILTVRLPASLFLSVKAWAKRKGMSRSAAVRSLLTLGLTSDLGTQTQPRPSLQSPGSRQNRAANRGADSIFGK
jgi:hypothetical protein